MKEIQSASNPVIKSLRSVKSKKYREKSGIYLIEGRKTIIEAFEYSAPVVYLLSDRYDEELFLKAQKSSAEVILTTYDLLRTLSDTKNPPNYLAYVKIESIKVNMEAGLTVALDRVSDPYNVGTIIRTADALGAVGVLCNAGSCDIYNPKVQRAAMGSMFHIDAEETNLKTRLKEFKSKGGYIITTSLKGEEKMPDIPDKTCLIMGNESEGVSGEIMNLSDFIYKIPMDGNAESLNVGVACGITIFEIKNQKRV